MLLTQAVWPQMFLSTLPSSQGTHPKIKERHYKTLLQESKPDKFLFGEGLADKMKEAKTSLQVGRSLFMGDTAKPPGNDRRLQPPGRKLPARRALVLATFFFATLTDHLHSRHVATFASTLSAHPPLNANPSRTRGRIPFLKVGVEAGRLRYFYEAWSTLTSDPSILNIIQGVSIPFTSTPIQTGNPVSSVASTDALSAITELLDAKAISPCQPCPGKFISPFFLVPKPDSTQTAFCVQSEMPKFLCSCSPF